MTDHIGRPPTTFETELSELIERVGAVLAHDTDRLQTMAALQGQVYADIDAALRRYIRERDTLLAGYQSHGRGGERPQ